MPYNPYRLNFNPGTRLAPYQPTNPFAMRFGQNITLPNQVQPQEQPPDFMGEYSKLNANRPNRLAYQQAVEQGSPEIQRGKWAKLGAMLASGAAGLANPNDPGGAYALGRSAYMEPQMRADEEYKKKLQGLGNLAQFEESDKANEIKALEMKYNDFYRRREDLRQEAETKRQSEAETRAGKLTDAQIKNLQEDNERQKWLVSEDKADGYTYLIHRDTGEKRRVAKTALTTQEQINAARDKVTAESAAKEPYDIRADARDTARALAVAKETTSRATTIQDMKTKADAAKSAARLREKATSMKPDDVMKNIYLDMAVAIEKGELPPEAPGYLTTENGVPTADRGWTGDKDVEDKVKSFISKSIQGSRAGGSAKSEESKTTEQPLTKQVRPKGSNNPADVRTAYSYDGGKTWTFEKR
jgi:hypothetical protein